MSWPPIGARSLRPMTPIVSEDGRMSASEQTISVGFDDGEYLIPTVVIDDEGYLVKVSNEDAIAMFRAGKNPAVGKFKTPEEATEFAKKRSKNGGRFQKKEMTPLEKIVGFQ